MKRMPSCLYWALNLAYVAFMAALLIEYGAAAAISKAEMSSMSAIPVVMVTTFLATPFWIRGRNSENR